KLAVDATIQERIAEHIRASAFAHSETVLMLAWVLGGATGLIPFSPRIGIAVATVVLVLSAVRGVVGAVALRDEKLTGVARGEVLGGGPDAPGPPAPLSRVVGRSRPLRGGQPPRIPGPGGPPLLVVTAVAAERDAIAAGWPGPVEIVGAGIAAAAAGTAR